MARRRSVIKSSTMRRFVVCALLVAACAGDGGGDLTVEGSTLTTDEDTPVSFTVEVSDPAAAGRAGASTPAHGSVTIEGLVVTYTPDKDFAGTDAFDIYVADDAPPSPNARVEVTVRPIDDAPLATDDHFAATEDVAFTQPFTKFLANDVEVDGDALTITAVGAATNGTVAIAGNEISFVPAANFAGTATFEYTVTDGTTSSTATVMLDVGMENDAPVAVDDTVTAVEDVQLQIPIASLLANDTDVDGQTITFAGIVSSTNCSPAPIGGMLYVTLAQNYNGVATLEYRVTDGVAMATGHVAITVTPVNDAPSAQTDTVTVPEDSSVDVVLASLASNDVDIDSANLTVVGAAMTSTYWAGSVTVANGIATFTPPPNFNGTSGFAYTVTDGQATAQGWVHVIVTNVNDAPAAVNDLMTVSEDANTWVSESQLLQNDSDIDVGSSLSIASVGNAINGTISMSSSGSISFISAPDFNGIASFDYTVTDGELTSTATVTVTVQPLYDPPRPRQDNLAGTEDTTMQIPVAQLLANDISPDGLPLTVTRVVLWDYGDSVSLENGVVTYTPAANENGWKGFGYYVSDGTTEVWGFGGITVAPVNDPPEARDDALIGSANTDLQISPYTLVSNDRDPDTAFLSVTAVGTASAGTVVRNANGTLTFTPPPDFVGTASFDYTVSDGTYTDTGIVYVVVQ